VAVPVVEVKDLHTHLVTRWGTVKAVDGVSFSVGEGETLGLVGESGSGKSMTCLSIVRLVPRPAARIVSGQVLLDGEDLLARSEREMQRIRGRKVAMILQDPMSSLNPYLTVERQMTEVLELHKGLTRKSALTLAIQTLEQVRIPDAARRIRMYPHEFSGGMRQRIMIAMALLLEPAVLVADEPTSALDVTLEAQIVELLRRLRDERGTAIVFVSHDLGVVAQLCDRVVVMYAGRTIEEGDVRSLYAKPLHPYTRALLAAVPSPSRRGARLATIPGRVPSLSALPQGCKFADRCEYVQPVNRGREPRYVEFEGRRVRCNIYDPDSGYEPRPEAPSAEVVEGRT
jgi:oligopeptide transport system ATP-binding protein